MGDTAVRGTHPLMLSPKVNVGDTIAMLPKSRRALTIQEIAALARSSLHGMHPLCACPWGLRGSGWAPSFLSFSNESSSLLLPPSQRHLWTLNYHHPSLSSQMLPSLCPYQPSSFCTLFQVFPRW